LQDRLLSTHDIINVVVICVCSAWWWTVDGSSDAGKWQGCASGIHLTLHWYAHSVTYLLPPAQRGGGNVL